MPTGRSGPLPEPSDAEIAQMQQETENYLVDHTAVGPLVRQHFNGPIRQRFDAMEDAIGDITQSVRSGYGARNVPTLGEKFYELSQRLDSVKNRIADSLAGGSNDWKRELQALQSDLHSIDTIAGDVQGGSPRDVARIHQSVQALRQMLDPSTFHRVIFPEESQ